MWPTRRPLPICTCVHLCDRVSSTACLGFQHEGNQKMPPRSVALHPINTWEKKTRKEDKSKVANQSHMHTKWCIRYTTQAVCYSVGPANTQIHARQQYQWTSDQHALLQMQQTVFFSVVSGSSVCACCVRMLHMCELNPILYYSHYPHPFTNYFNKSHSARARGFLSTRNIFRSLCYHLILSCTSTCTVPNRIHTLSHVVCDHFE